MQALNCLIVEDEPFAAGIVADYIREVPGLALVASCETALEAIELLRKEKIDLIFLDINLPKLSGIDFLKSISYSGQIVLVTAYHQYALESYELNVTDYLLKPVEFRRFLQAVNKVFERAGHSQIQSEQEKSAYFFNVDKTRIKVFADEILYIESLKDYVRIHTTGKSLVTKFAIGEIENLLKNKSFLRIHKSFIVNVQKIVLYKTNSVTIGQVKLTIGRTYRKNVLDQLKRMDSRRLPL